MCVLTEREATFKQLRSQGLLGVTFEPLGRVCECVCAYLVPVCSAPLPAVQRLQPAGPCGTHLTGEQRRLSAYTAHESREGREAEGFCSPRKNRPAGRRAAGEDVGSRQKGRAAEQT